MPNMDNKEDPIIGSGRCSADFDDEVEEDFNRKEIKHNKRSLTPFKEPDRFVDNGSSVKTLVPLNNGKTEKVDDKEEKT